MAKTDGQRQQETHVRTRASASLPSSVDGRSFDVTIFTEAPVRTVIKDPRVTPKDGEPHPQINPDAFDVPAARKRLAC